MIKVEQSFLRLISRRFWGTVFTLVIALAVIVQLGRQAFPLLKDYQNDIATYFGDRLGVVVELESIDASWSGLRPKLSLLDVHIRSKDGESIFKIDEATAELSLLSSIADRRLSWRQLMLTGFETTLIQEERGWSIRGMPKRARKPNTNNNFVIDDLYDIFLIGRRINIADANFNFHYRSGKTAKATIPDISIENDRDFHRINASMDIDGQEAFSLVIEGHGDPRDTNFVANGHLALKEFPANQVVSALPFQSIDKVTNEQRIDLQIWFRGDADMGTTFRGELNTHGNIEIAGKEINLPNSLHTQIYGKVRQDRGWEFSLKSFTFNWEEEHKSPSLNLSFFGDFKGLSGIRVQELDVEAWSQLALHVGLNNKPAEDAITTIAPKGKLKDILVKLTDKESGYFHAVANVEKGYSNAIMGAPALSNINGFVSLNMLEGFIDVRVNDGLGVYLPKVYHDPLHFDAADGQIRWKVDLKKRMTYISSGLITVTNPEEQGKGFLHLSLPFAKKYGEQEMTLSLGIENTLAKNHKKYVPKTIPKHLYQWLDTSIKQGRVTNARFLYHGSVEKDPITSPTIQLYGEVYDGNLAFDPGWPELEGVTGRLVLENNDLDVSISKASLLGNSVYDAQISLVKDKTVDDGRALSIKGSISSDAKSAMTLLKSSPIKQYMGSTFDTWTVSGGVGAEIELLVPLSSDSPGLSHKIEVNLAKAKLVIPEIDIEIDNIEGKFFYETEDGIYADKLDGSVWGKAYQASISSPRNEFGGQDTLIEFKGRAHVDDLYTWTSRPELKFAQGDSDFQASLFIPGEKSNRAMEVNIQSALEGVTLDMPAPLQKDSDKKIDFATRIRFFDNGDEYQFRFNDEVRVSMLAAKSGSTSAYIELNNFDASTPRDAVQADTGRFDIAGNIQFLDLEQWITTKDRYFQYMDESGIASEEEDTTPVKFKLSVDLFRLGGLDIDTLIVDGERRAPNWYIYLNSELMTGEVSVPETDDPIVLDLDFLRIVSDETESESELAESTTQDVLPESVFADLDLSDMVAIDFSTKEFTLDKDNYGAWSFNMRPVGEGLAFHNVRANAKAMNIGNEEKGAEFLWIKNEGKQESQFKGTVTAKDLADVFVAWGQEKLMVSENAVFEIDAHWPGAPDQFTLKTIKGLVQMELTKGSFTRGEGSDENGLLRLIALFNFDTILRRLRLDFSDLAAQGYSYDKVYGSLDFNDGKIFLTDPLIVESSSSYIQLVGTVDLINEKVDNEMVVTLPVASNVAVATALVVGLPAALGVYVMSKLFKKQVDRASSLSVNVSGDWEDPKVKVKKIFDIDAASRRGKEMKKQQTTDKNSPGGENR